MPDKVEAPACLTGQKMDNAPVSTNTNNSISNISPAPTKVLTPPAPPVSVVKPTQGVKVEYRIQFTISKQLFLKIILVIIIHIILHIKHVISSEATL